MTKKIEVFASEALPGELEDFPDIKRGWGTTKESTGGIPPMKWFNAIQKRTDESINDIYATQESINDSVNDIYSKMGEWPLFVSSVDGNLSLALSKSSNVVIDKDIYLDKDVVLGSNTSITTLNDCKVFVKKNGKIRTQSIVPLQYWRDNADNRQIPIIKDSMSGSSSLTLQDTSGLSIGDKLILKNGYCDMWRVLERGNDQRSASDNVTYKTEIVEIKAIQGNVITIDNLLYDYKVTPDVYGYLEDENKLSNYEGYTRPSATKMLYNDITIQANFVVGTDINYTFVDLSFVDGVDVSYTLESNATIDNAVRLSMCDNVNVHDVYVNNHKGGAIQVHETSRGMLHNFTVDNWRGGVDSPIKVMVMATFNSSNVRVSSSVRHDGSSAIYYNTVNGGNVSNVISSNTAKVVDVSFSKAVNVSNLTGYNCDFSMGAFCASSCSCSGATLDGYCFINKDSDIYKPVLVFCQYCTNVTYSNVIRVNDKGYGGVRINNSVGITLNNIKSPETGLYVVIQTKDKEPAIGHKIVEGDSLFFKNFSRYSQYYDGEDQAGYSYPSVCMRHLHLTNGGTVELGQHFSISDSYNLTTDAVVKLSNAVMGLEISGYVGGLALANPSYKDTCYPYIRDLIMKKKPDVGIFNSVDTLISEGKLTNVNFENGAKITDVYSRQSYINSSNKGNTPVWNKC